jgi:TnpA family transposase
MPKGFLTDAQRERLNRFPDDLPRDDLSAYFTLSGADIEIIKSQRHEHTQLGFALQLCTLRYLGFVPNDLSTVPVAATTFILLGTSLS